MTLTFSISDYLVLFVLSCMNVIIQVVEFHVAGGEINGCQEVSAEWVHPTCANAHNCFGLTLGRCKNLKRVLLAQLCLTQQYNAQISASTCLMDIRGLRVTSNTHFLLSTHTNKLLLMTYCDSERNCTDQMDGETDVMVKIVIQIVHKIIWTIKAPKKHKKFQNKKL